MANVLDRFKTAHLWIGQVSTSTEEYLAYFEQRYCEQSDTVDFSQFFRDIGSLEEYDEDFIIIFEPLAKAVNIEELFPEIPLANKNEYDAVQSLCNNLPISQFNTFVFYSDPELIVPNDKMYNELYYLGDFNAECI